jgi:hypothetical protein
MWYFCGQDIVVPLPSSRPSMPNQQTRDIHGHGLNLRQRATRSCIVPRIPAVAEMLALVLMDCLLEQDKYGWSYPHGLFLLLETIQSVWLNNKPGLFVTIISENQFVMFLMYLKMMYYLFPPFPVFEHHHLSGPLQARRVRRYAK